MKLSRLVPLGSLLAVFASSGVKADGFTLESASFGPNTTLATKHVYNEGGCNGGNVSPELHWSGAPEGTKSFAITMFDPDARGGAGWWHWLLFDIGAKTTSLEPGAGAAAGTSAKNDFGEAGYGGPCPPRGDTPHHYVFTVYALRSEHLGVDANADAAAVKKALEANALLSTSLQALYGR